MDEEHKDSKLIESIEVHYDKNRNLFVFLINDEEEYSISPIDYTSFVNASMAAINDVVVKHFSSSMRKFIKSKVVGSKSTVEEVEEWLKKRGRRK
jgi:hypothetical protein